MSDPFTTFGPPELCAWRYASGVCRIQTRSPLFARKLSQRSKARLVAWSVSGGYLRIFQERIQPWRARCLVSRYIAAANGAFSRCLKGQNRSKILPRVKTLGATTDAALSAAIGGDTQ